MKFRTDKDILFEAGFFIFLVLIFFARWLQNTSNQHLSLFIAIWATMLVRTIYQSTKSKPTVILVDERGQYALFAFYFHKKGDI
ncbi:MAG: hypothetical protein FIB07_06640 [Candidatus Methanoperedens sp.]|nr:hypothetical protein [Candidatus Methanoperedens sp.]